MCWKDLGLLYEGFKKTTRCFLYTAFDVIDDDDVHISQLKYLQSQDQFRAVHICAKPYSRRRYFSRAASDEQLTPAPEVLVTDFYIKRPRLMMYAEYKEHDILSAREFISPVILQDRGTCTGYDPF